ncbi:Tetraspanin family-domain-containing protein [Halteromyces radiatus]|uniref:Tetraspanin family-domain-containing protein n=1 Tax=Halteromyces radiatus TaxID=101107 RepID=UPI00221F83A7|nr:Tetraspanin family-domain-containing protein [Halteromyces radiatus]KAI8097488.1 Tetraspanin family-domain-containing protein [Halteromyces radiatus]
MSCCERLSKWYIITVNFLIACFGCGLMAFGLMSSQLKFNDAILFPVNIIKMINILGVLILFTAVIGTIGAFYRERKTIHIIYLVIAIIAFGFQMITAVVIYQLTANAKTWLSVTWAEATKDYREYAQNKFSCCGYANSLDHPVVNQFCSATDTKNNLPPCFDPLVHFIRHELKNVYIVLFAALSVEILAICNGITLLCTRTIDIPESIELQKRKVSSATLIDSAIDQSLDITGTKYHHSYINHAN